PPPPPSPPFPYTTLFRSRQRQPRGGEAVTSVGLRQVDWRPFEPPAWRSESSPEASISLRKRRVSGPVIGLKRMPSAIPAISSVRSEEHTSELQSRFDLVC